MTEIRNFLSNLGANELIVVCSAARIPEGGGEGRRRNETP